MHLRSRRPALAALGSLAVLATISLSACGSDDEAGASSADDSPSAVASDDTPDESAETSTETPTESETVEEPPPPPSGDGESPNWALPVAKAGELLTTIEAGDVSVEVYQVGTAKADDTGSFVNPDNNKPLIEVGDTLVFLNYVITNNGDPIDLGSSLVDVSARYQDWPYMQGMDGLTGDDLYEAQGVHDGDLAPGGFNEAGIYTLGTGQSYSAAENFEYQKNSPIDFTVSYVPVDAEGELIFDDKVEAEGTAKIS